jgi:preprotein translocase subunit SecE
MDRLFAYLRQSRNELTKVVWPTRRNAIRLSIGVVIFSVVLALFIGLWDFLFTQLIQKIILKG